MASKFRAAAANLLCGLMLYCWMGAVWAEVVGTVSHLRGTLSVLRSDNSRGFLAVQSEINQGDLLTTEKNTYARVKFNDQSEVVLRPATQLKVENFNFVDLQPERDSALLTLIKGGLRKVTGLIGKRNPAVEQLATPVATIGIRGTHYGLLFCQNDCADIPTVSGKVLPEGLHLDVAKGAILVQNSAGFLEVHDGQFGYVKDLETAPVLVSPADGVQVTIPPAILNNDSDGGSLDQEHSEGTCLIN